MNAASTQKRTRKKSGAPGTSARRRAILIALAALFLCASAAVLYYLFRYQFNYEYRKYLQQTYIDEQGGAFTPLLDDSPAVPGYALAARNDILRLYVNIETAEVAVYDLRNGSVVYSNPPQAQDDPVANKTNKNYLRSQFILDYYNQSRTAGTYDSYSMSVAKGQVTAESIENGVRFVYELGDQPKIEYYVPGFLSADKFEEILSFQDESGQATLRRMYILGGSGLYELIKSATANRKSRAKIDALLQIAGFTTEDYYLQEALGGSEQAEALSFSVALEYRISGDAVEVSLPVGRMEERGGGWIYRVQLLRFMGAAGADESGYLVLPNGSGSLLYFNNGKTNTAAYSQYLYGIDLIDADYTQTQNTVPARLPLYGICRSASGILATVERGASLCYLTADVAGRYNSYNYCYPTFILRGYDMLSMFGVSGAEADMPILEKELYDENITVRYTLLTDEFKGYSGLANYYRGRLISEGRLEKQSEGGDIPFYYDVIGGVKQTAHFLGAEYLRVYPMTTFAEAADMAQSLLDLGVSNQIMNFQGWFNGGYYHDAADRVRVLSNLGGRKGLEELSGFLSSVGGEFYADAAFQNVTMISRHYASSLESSRYYGAGYAAILGQVNPGTLRRTSSLGYEETYYSLLSPKFLPHYVQAFAKAIGSYDIFGLSLRDLGDELHADKRRTNVISREQALSVVRAQLETLKDTGKRLMINGGNCYALDYAAHIINAPLADTEFFITDGGIPLYEMILHGCVDYAGTALNLKDSSDRQLELLRFIEYGASCHYVFTWQDAAKMKYTGLNRYYATTFSNWADEAAETYAYLNGALSRVSGALMISHDVLENGVVRVLYENGVVIYVNYSDRQLPADGFLVPARDYLAAGGEGE